MNEFLEIEYDEKGRKFLLEVYADGKEEIKDKIKIEKNTKGKTKKQIIEYMDLIENKLIFMNARFVCRNKNNKKEDEDSPNFNFYYEKIFRLFYTFAKNRPKELPFNYAVITMKFDFNVFKVKKIVFPKIISPNSSKEVNNNELTFNLRLDDIKKMSNDDKSKHPKYFDLRYSINYEDPKTHEDQKDTRIKRIYLTLDAIDTSKSKKKKKYVLINSMFTIVDSFFDRVTSQIFTSCVINDYIIEQINNHNIKYVIFLNEKDKVKNSKFFQTENCSVEQFSFTCTSVDKLGKIIEFFVKYKQDIIYIYNLNFFLSINMKKQLKFDIQDYDYLYNENPSSIE